MTTSGPILTQFRHATKGVHERLEAPMDPSVWLAGAARRRELLRRYLDFHAAAEPAVEPWVADLAGLDFAARKRLPLIVDALRACGGSAAANVPAAPKVESRSEALGFLYVVEGSALGGRVILRDLTRRGADTARLGFLDPYGPDTKVRWGDFLRVLEREAGGAASGAQQAVAGAVKGFRFAEACFCGESAPA